MATYDGYRINEQGVIISPGKFEGCYKTVPELWAEGLEGGAEDDFEGGFGFLISDPNGRDVSPCILTEDKNGFVYAEYFKTVAEYRKAIEGIENADASDDEQDKEISTPWKRD